MRSYASLGEQPLLAVPLLPQAVDGKGHQRQRAALALHLGDHPVHQQLGFEAVELPRRRLLERSPEPFGAWAAAVASGP